MIEEGTSLSSLSVDNAFLHGVGEEVAGFDFDLAVLVLVTLLGGRWVLLVDVGRHRVLFVVGHCLCWSEVHLVAAELGVAVLDECALAGVEHGALVVSAVSGVIAGLGDVDFFVDVGHLLLEVSFVCADVDFIVLASFDLVGEEVPGLGEGLASVGIPRVSDLGELIGVAEGGCSWHLEHSEFRSVFLPAKQTD